MMANIDSSLIVEGWLNVWEVGKDAELALFADGKTPVPIWEPHLCVMNMDTRRLSHFRNDKAAVDSRCGASVTVVRVGCCKEDFDRHHGIRPVEQGMEIMLMKVPMLPSTGEMCHQCLTPDNRSSTMSRQQQHQGGDCERTERRGSISSEYSEEAVKATASHSKIVNFFSRKSQMLRIKRTKSGTKLDSTIKKSTGEQTIIESSCTIGGGDSAVISTIDVNRLANQVRASQSHEALFPSPPTGLHSIDLSAHGVSVRPLHCSILGHPYCFQVSTSNGSKYYACRTGEDQQTWLTYFRRCMHPRRFLQYRTDYSLIVCISEAKNLPPKKRYFCEVCCDKVCYAKTSAKSDVLLWNEAFEFTNLPSVNTLTINIYREADKKKRKDRHTLLGCVNVNVSGIKTHQLEERWYPVTSAVVGRSNRDNRIDCASMRIKARYQSVSILPVMLYEPLAQWLRSEYSLLVEVLESAVDVKMKEKIAAVLVAVFHKMNLVEELLTDILVAEINKLDNDTLALRGNSIATKAVESYMKLVGQKYLQDTLNNAVKMLLDPNIDCEVDPSKIQCPDNLPANQQSLVHFSELIWFKILNTHPHFPPELKAVFCALRQRCHSQHSQALCDQLVSSCVFLRFLCPAILSPNMFGFTQELPSQKATRNITLVAKTIQSLANFTGFGVKEEWMAFMNDFVSRELTNMHNFLQNISDACSDDDTSARYTGYIDHGKELALLHYLLLECLTKGSISEAGKQKLEPLQSILSQITSYLDNPVAINVDSPLHRTSFRLHVSSRNSSGQQHQSNRIIPPAVSNDGTPCRSSDDLRFVSKKSLNLSAVSPPPLAKIVTTSPPIQSRSTHIDSATIPSSASRHRQQLANDVSTGAFKAGPKPLRYQSTDAVVLTTPGILAPPDVLASTSSVSSVSTTASRRPDEKRVNQCWQRMVDAASSDRIDFVSFDDDLLPQMNGALDSSRLGPTAMPRTAARLENSPTLVFTVDLSPSARARSVDKSLENVYLCPETPSLVNGNTPAPPPVQPKPLSFANPLYGGCRILQATTADNRKTITVSTAPVQGNTAAAAYPLGYQTVPGPKPASYKSDAEKSTTPIVSRTTPLRTVHTQPTALSSSTPVGSGSHVRRSRQYGELASSSESLDSVLMPRPAVKPRITANISYFSPRLAHSANRINVDSQPTARRPVEWNATAPRGGIDRGNERRDSDFGALKRLWQSIELPMVNANSPGSAKSFSIAKRGNVRDSSGQRDSSSRFNQSASFDGGLSDFCSTRTPKKGHSYDSLLSGPTQSSNSSATSSAAATMPRNRTAGKTYDDHREYAQQFDTVCQQVADTQALILDAENRLLLRRHDDDNDDSTLPQDQSLQSDTTSNAHSRSPPGVDPCGRWVVWL